jgi:hypothetical protein
MNKKKDNTDLNIYENPEPWVEGDKVNWPVWLTLGIIIIVMIYMFYVMFLK